MVCSYSCCACNGQGCQMKDKFRENFFIALPAAIVMANPIAKEMAQKYGITPRKTASILDTFSCIFQGMIPYGAQMLVAISAVHELGHEVSAFNILPYLFYPMFLLVSSLVAIGRKK